MLMDADVIRVPMAGPSDVSELARLIDRGEVDPRTIIAVLAQTEGDGYARGYAAQAFELLLAERMGIKREEVAARIPLMMIGGTAGVMSPHANLFLRKKVRASGGPGKRLALGVHTSRVLLPEEYGTMVQVQEVAAAVRMAMADAGITDPADVHCVEVKCPAMTVARVAEAQKRGHAVRSTNPAQASSYAKGASALGVALALGEVKPAKLSDEVICRDWSLYSTVASTSAGSEQVACRVLVIGNSARSVSRLLAGHGIMKDALDLEGAKEALRAAGLRFRCCPAPRELRRVVTVLVNAGADGLGTCRGRRHTIHSDFLWSFAGHHAKAVANAVVGALVGDPMILASAGAEHQGPPGANLVAVIAKAR